MPSITIFHQELQHQLRVQLTKLHAYFKNHSDYLENQSTHSSLDKLEADLFHQLQQLFDTPEEQITADNLTELKTNLENYATTKSQQLVDLWNKPKGLNYYMSKHNRLKPEHNELVSHLHNTSNCANRTVDLLNQIILQQPKTLSAA